MSKPELAKDLPFLATRVQREIHDWVEEEAARNKRSKSAQLAWLLERLWESHREESGPPPAAASRKPKRASALAIAAIGAAALLGGGAADANSRVSTFSEPGLHILSTWRRRQYAEAA